MLLERNLDEDDLDMDAFEQQAEMAEADAYTVESYDKYLSAEVMLPLGDKLQTAKVMKRKRDDNNIPIGIANNNPLLDTRVYQVQFPDGTEK